MGAERGNADPLGVAAAAIAWWTSTSTGAGTGPTSSLTGGGAIAQLEAELGDRLGGYVLALPSGTSALRCGLRVLGASAGSRVGLHDESWFGAAAIVRSVGAHPVGADAPADIRICSLHGPSGHDVEPVLLDGADLHPDDHRRVASAPWTALALSFGPGKAIDAGEGGALVARSRPHLLAAVRLTQHPIRQRLAGVFPPGLDQPIERIHPVAAVTALHQLRVVHSRDLSGTQRGGHS